MAKELKAVSPEAVQQKTIDLITFLEANNYSYIITDDGFMVGVKTLELVNKSAIFVPGEK